MTKHTTHQNLRTFHWLLAAGTAMLLPAATAEAQTATPLPPVTVEKPAKPKAKPKPPVSQPAGEPAAAASEEAAAAPAAGKGLSKPLTSTTVKGEATASQVPATSDTASLIASVPGVSLYSGGGVSNLPVVRGLNDERVITVINGMPIFAACGNHMNPVLSHVDPAAVQRVDVTAGISPVSAGGDALGSVIAVEAGTPQFARAGDGVALHGSLSAFARSVNDGIGGSVSASAATGNAAIAYTGAWSKAGNYTDGNGHDVGSTSYEAQNHLLTLAARGTADVLVVNGGYQTIPYQGFVNQWMDMTDNEAWFVNGRYERKFDWGKLYLQAYYQHTDHEMEFMPDKKLPRIASGRMPAMPMLTEGENMGYKIKAEMPFLAQSMLRIGNELHRNTLDDWWPAVPGTMMMWPNTFWNINGGERTRLGTFAEVGTKWSKEWSTLAGVRNDVVWMDTGPVIGYQSTGIYKTDSDAFNTRDRSKTDINFDVTALARYQPEATSTYEFGYARKTRSPSLYERYTWARHPMAMKMQGWFGDTNGYIGDPDLKPEVANTLSFTADWHDRAKKDWQVKATPYVTYVQDYIGVKYLPDYMMGAFPISGKDNCSWSNPPGCGFFPAGSPNGTGNSLLKFTNHDAVLYGIDVSGSKRLWESYEYGLFTLTGALSYVHGENADSGDPLYHMMPLNVRIGLEHKLGHWTNSIELNAVADKDRVDPLRKELQTSGYAIVNLRSSYEWEHLRLDFGVSNVFDQYYQLPLGGVDIGHFQVPVTVGPVAGEGRSFYAGMTVKF